MFQSFYHAGNSHRHLHSQDAVRTLTPVYLQPPVSVLPQHQGADLPHQAMADLRETSTHTDQYPVQDRAHQDGTEPVHAPCLHALVHHQEDEEDGGIAQVVMEEEGEEVQVIAATAVMTIAAEAEVVAEEDVADVRT
jgi:hypothetical protein